MDNGKAENVAAGSLTRKIYQELRADIIRCRLPPGERLRIATLQDRFDTSLSAVREALSRLSSEGFVVATDQRGFCVASVSPEDLEDLVRTRRRIEAVALRQAIEIGDPEWEAAASAAYADLVRQDQRAGPEYTTDLQWVAAHERFHHCLIIGCKSYWLTSICGQLAERTQRYRYLAAAVPPNRDGPAEHRAIFNAVLARDADRAVALLDAHFAETARRLIEAYSKAERGKTVAADANSGASKRKSRSKKMNTDTLS